MAIGGLIALTDRRYRIAVRAERAGQGAPVAPAAA
jgi:hypothetical protein